MKNRFVQHVRGAPKKLSWQKRHDFSYERKKTIIKIEDMPRLKSPSPFEEGKTPMYVLNLHARRDGDCKYPLISSTQSITGAQLGEVLAYTILDLSGKLDYNPCALASAINKAVVEAYNNRIEQLEKQNEKIRTRTCRT